MEQVQQTAQNTTPVLMEFFGEQDKTTWLSGRSLDSLELWERACVECGFIPPATKNEFLYFIDHPKLEGWRVQFRKAEFKTNLRAQLEAQGVPAHVIDKAIAEMDEKLGDKLADVEVGDIKVLKMENGEITDPSGAEVPADVLESFKAEIQADIEEEQQTPLDIITEGIKLVIEREKSDERKAIARMIMEMDPVAGLRFAEAIRQREADLNQCECEACVELRAKKAEPKAA